MPRYNATKLAGGLNLRDFVITLDLKNNTLFVGQDNSSGCSYVVKNNKDILKAINDYLTNYLV